MGYHISWLVEGYVIDVTFDGILTAEELEDQAYTAMEYMNNGESAHIHSILDLTKLEKIPVNKSMFNRSFAAPLNHPRVGWNVLVTKSSMVKLLTAAFLGLSAAHYRIFPTREEALAFLNEVDGTLPNLLEIKSNN